MLPIHQMIYIDFDYCQVFPKGSPLVADVSRAILKVTEGDEIVGIEKKWLGVDEVACNSRRNAFESGSVITWSSLQGVFLITFCLWVAAGIIYAVIKFLEPCGQVTRPREAVAEFSIEHRNGDDTEDTTWRVERDSHLVFHLRGNSPQAQVEVAQPQIHPARPGRNGGDVHEEGGEGRGGDHQVELADQNVHGDALSLRLNQQAGQHQ